MVDGSEKDWWALTDPARLEALRASGLLDSEPEESFDRLTRLAALTLDVPVAFFALVTPDRQFFKSQVGLPEPVAEARETSLALSLCQYTVRRCKTESIPDLARAEVPEAANVESVFGLRSYLGSPVVTDEGHVVGSFSVMDEVARDWTAEEEGLVRDLAAAAATEFNLRTEVAEHEFARAELQAEQSRLAGILEALGEGITIHDADGILVYANEAAERILGLERSDMEGRSYRSPEWKIRTLDGEPVDPDDLPAARAVEEGLPVRGELMVVERPDADPVVLSVNAVPIAGGVGENELAVISFRDVTERKRLEVELREREQQYETILTEISDVVTVLDEDGRIRYQSPSIEKVFGYGAEELVGRPAFELVHPEDVDGVAEAFFATVEDRGEGQRTVQYRFRHSDGSWRLVESTGVLHADAELGPVVVTRDITDRTEAQEKYRVIFRTTPSAVGLATLEEGEFVDVNPAFEELLGRSREEVVGSTAEKLGVWARPDQRERVVERLRESGFVHNLEAEFRNADGEIVDVLFSGSVLDLGARSYLVGVAKDITERKQFEKALERQALHDQLTGIPNRMLFRGRLGHALERAERTEAWVAVLFLDLDRFKT
ncbi:MAG: PAS domain S-box protein, partial [Gemmatimonadota bacterium]